MHCRSHCPLLRCTHVAEEEIVMPGWTWRAVAAAVGVLIVWQAGYAKDDEPAGGHAFGGEPW